MTQKELSRRGVAIALFAVLLISCSVAMAQYQTMILADPIYVSSLSGHVQDQTRNALKNAHVELVDPKSGKLLASTATDANANFHFEGFPKSTYKLNVSMPNFDPLKATLRIRKNAPQSAVLTLVVAS